MTKEEVIQALENMIMYGDPWEVNVEACEEAIKLINDSNSWDD